MKSVKNVSTKTIIINCLPFPVNLVYLQDLRIRIGDHKNSIHNESNLGLNIIMTDRT